MEVTESEYPWEREALGYLRERLPDTEPFRAWSNFEFIAEDGSINEVDLLVVSLYKIYLVEIKSRPGRLTGDTGTWTWSHDGRDFIDDNPLLLANRKAKKLKGLLQRQGALRRHRAPYVEPVVFLSGRSLRCELGKAARTGVYLGRETERDAHLDIVKVLAGRPPAPGWTRCRRPAHRPNPLEGYRACHRSDGDPTLAATAACRGLRTRAPDPGDRRVSRLGGRACELPEVPAANPRLSGGAAIV